MAVGIRRTLNKLRVPFVVTTAAAAVACGGSADGGGSAGASGHGGSVSMGGSAPSGGSGAMGGATAGKGASGGADTFGGSGGFGAFGGSAGYGGSSVGGGSGECPAAAQGGQSCVGVGAGTQCAYSVDCESGSQSLSYTCSAQGTWQLDRTACSHSFDSCQSVYVQCLDGTWSAWGESGGSNPPPPCPAERPDAGSTCADILTFGGAPTCGYYCDDGQTWTVASCSLDPEYLWGLDGACEAL